MHPRVVLSVTILLISSFALVGCGSRIVVPLRVCIVEGSDLAAQPPAARDAALEQAFNVVNEFWHAKADIHFLPLSVRDHIHLVITDPEGPPPGVPAKPGDIDIGSLGESTEMISAYQNCTSVWPQTDKGFVVLIARNLVSVRRPATQGANPGHTRTTNRNGARDLCVSPRKLLVEDVARQYALVPEPARFMLGPGAPDREGNFEDTLAHELGHCLLLGHGDGLDNDENGVSPPSPGARLFDEDCDPSEFQAIDESPSTVTRSLMSPAGRMFLVLTPLQRELARDAAVLVPGAATGVPWLWQ